jgi:hypothetical protein
MSHANEWCTLQRLPDIKFPIILHKRKDMYLRPQVAIWAPVANDPCLTWAIDYVLV